ncbi:MAG: YafY family protein [Clostridia bacterium]|nr:YafY family protein [Clostridia bacterium]
MKNNRLFGIIYILLSKDSVTAKELADYFEVSVRTIYRDIELLSTLHIPIYTSKGKNGGISLLDSYKLDKALLSEEEQNQILFALQSLEKLGVNTNSILDKMKLLFQKENKEWISVDFSVWGKDVIQNIAFQKVKQAILEEKKIEFDYYNAYGKVSRRIVEPLKMCFQYNAWYVLAFDEQKRDYRMFKMTRIKNLNQLNETFVREIPNKIWKEDKKPNMVSLVLEISKEVAYRVYDEFCSDHITMMDNGDFLVRVEFPESDWVYGYILSFGEYMKVISPEYVKKTIQVKLEKSIHKYL